MSTLQAARLTFSLSRLAARSTAADVAHEVPGLWMRERLRSPTLPDPIRVAGMTAEHGQTSAVLIASVPLTREAWQPMRECEVIAVRQVKVIAANLPTLHV